MRWPLLVLGLVACATYSQVYVNPYGQMMQCSATGQGLVGMATASNATGRCGDDLRRAGYLELDSAGVIGIQLSPSPAGARVLQVAPNGPAKAAGVEVDDILVSVDGTKVGSLQDAQLLLFGRTGTSVVLKLRRGDVEVDRTVERVPYPSIHGTR